MSAEHDNHSSHFIVPVKYYFATFIGLLILTFLTVFVAQFHFGEFNVIVAMLIAFFKASLVVLFFMGLKWEKGFNRLFFVGCLIFFFIFILLTLSDVHYRRYTDTLEAQTFGTKQIVTPMSEAADDHHSGHGN